MSELERPAGTYSPRRDRRLADAEVQAIRRSAETYRVLADRYGCSTAEICHIRKGKHYRLPLHRKDWV